MEHHSESDILLLINVRSAHSKHMYSICPDWCVCTPDSISPALECKPKYFGLLWVYRPQRSKTSIVQLTLLLALTGGHTFVVIDSLISENDMTEISPSRVPPRLSKSTQCLSSLPVRWLGLFSKNMKALEPRRVQEKTKVVSNGYGDSCLEMPTG